MKMTILVTMVVASLIALHPAGAVQNRQSDWKAWLVAEAAGFSGVALIGRDDAIDIEMAFGRADPAGGRRNTAATRFNLGSITKTFTAIGIAQLIEQGRLGLDDRLIQHLPDYPNKDAATRISIRQLLCKRRPILYRRRAHSRRRPAPQRHGADSRVLQPGSRRRGLEARDC